eukprot:GHVL01036399.1.p1 GENE.GHVL01036399.1~~GHVL01036399.1.p1  ORF type:complete len:419 (-),score=93.62 GHVL01036399.1:36-1238(-)
MSSARRRNSLGALESEYHDITSNCNIGLKKTWKCKNPGKITMAKAKYDMTQIWIMTVIFRFIFNIIIYFKNIFCKNKDTNIDIERGNIENNDGNSIYLEKSEFSAATKMFSISGHGPLPSFTCTTPAIENDSKILSNLIQIVVSGDNLRDEWIQSANQIVSILRQEVYEPSYTWGGEAVEKPAWNMQPLAGIKSPTISFIHYHQGYLVGMTCDNELITPYMTMKGDLPDKVSQVMVCFRTPFDEPIWNKIKFTKTEPAQIIDIVYHPVTFYTIPNNELKSRAEQSPSLRHRRRQIIPDSGPGVMVDARVSEDTQVSMTQFEEDSKALADLTDSESKRLSPPPVIISNNLSSDLSLDKESPPPPQWRFEITLKNNHIYTDGVPSLIILRRILEGYIYKDIY